MKNTIKKIFVALAATAMCAVPMTSAMTASADLKSEEQQAWEDEQDAIVERAIVKRFLKKDGRLGTLALSFGRKGYVDPDYIPIVIDPDEEIDWNPGYIDPIPDSVYIASGSLARELNRGRVAVIVRK